MAPKKSQRTEKRHSLLQLQSIVQEVSRISDLSEASRILVTRVREAMRTDACSVYLRDPHDKSMVLFATDGLNPAAVGGVRLTAGEGLVGLVAMSGETINVHNAYRHSHFKLISGFGEERHRGFLGVPILLRGETLGVIVVQQLNARRYRDTDAAFLITIAVQLAGVIALAQASSSIDLDSKVGKRLEVHLDAVAGAPGVAVGVGTVVYSAADLDTIPDRFPEDKKAEENAFLSAIDKVTQKLRELQTDLGATLPPGDQALFDALAMMVSSQELVDATLSRIHGGNWAPGALRATIDEYVNRFAEMNDPYLKERGRDIRDLGRRILEQLLSPDVQQRQWPENSILIGEELGPIDLVKIPFDRLVGIVSGHGSVLSHLSILARAMGIPAIVGTAGIVSITELEGKQLIIDGYQGRLYVSPGIALRKEYSRLLEEEKALSRQLDNLRDLPAETTDGVRVSLFANAGIATDLSHSLAVGSEGIGLYRTEVPFMLCEQFPGEDEQQSIYRHILQTFAPRPVTLRTLDIGGDKTLPYFPVDEPNPVLGWRGIRFALDTPVILTTQLRAMMRASVGLNNLRILVPMISSVEEAEEVGLLIQQTWRQMVAEGEAVKCPLWGVMIEVPAAVLQADALTRISDFVSIGTNDLTQFLLAVDRSNERVGGRFDSLHPAVIKALEQVVLAGKQSDTPVSVCGQAAGDPAMALLMLGMGIRNLSVSASDLPRVKAVIRAFSFERAQKLLKDVRNLEKAGMIRDHLARALAESGLAGLLRAGN